MYPSIKSSSTSSIVWWRRRPDELGLEAKRVVRHLHPRQSHAPKACGNGSGYWETLQIKTSLLWRSWMDDASKLHSLDLVDLRLAWGDSPGHIRIGSDMAHMGSGLLAGKNQRQAHWIEAVKAAGRIDSLLSSRRQTHQMIVGQKVSDSCLHIQMIAQ